ncbi:MAG: hypothetical protein IJX51_02440 [Clostridia bacterium]|nr:hypothetical protein [Clostridia bacterium]
MNERISKLCALTLDGKMYVETIKPNFDRYDYFLPTEQMNVKRLCEYILCQKPVITENSLFTGLFRFDGSVVGDAFNRSGHKNTAIALKNFYLKKIGNLSTMEWQHATGDYSRVLKKGIKGIIEDIDASALMHYKPEELEFLKGLKDVANTIIKWAEKCSDKVLEFSKSVSDPTKKNNLEKLASSLLLVPRNAPSSLYEAILTMYICFSANPDSVGTLDRYLSPFYFNDIKNGTITRDEAKEYLQEFFLMLQSYTHISSPHFTRGGQSHFCIGGYLEDGIDGFNEFSVLIVESLMELPTYIPQLTFRWTSKTPKDVLWFMMDCERKDPNKRIAFTNDDMRIACYTKICGIPFEKAVSYTTVGCNEPAFLGSMAGSNSKGNLLHSIETLFHKNYGKIINCKSFDEFYGIYESILFDDLEKIFEYDNKYNKIRARDINYISSLFACDCIENAKSITQGGCNTAIASPTLMGIINVIDSLIVVKKYVFDEKLMSMKSLIDALHSNWQGYGMYRTVILNTTDFFGNDDNLSNYITSLFYDSLYKFINGKKNIFGYQWLVGDLAGYNEHYKWYGEDTLATPDGRYMGDMMKFGVGQNEGRDRNGLTALLNSVIVAHKNLIACGSTVTNVSLDKKLVEDDEQFSKLVDTFETYFRNGGVHFQLTYISKEDLIAAKENPDKYKHIRVRVSGFSDYFVNLNESIQNDIIMRTDK